MLFYLKERQCTLKGQARYVNVRGSVHWKGVYTVDFIVLTVSINNLLQFLSRVFKGPPVNT